MFWGSGDISITQKAPAIHWREKIPSRVWQWDLGACWAEKREGGALCEFCWFLIPEMYFTSWGIKRFTGESVHCQRIESRFYNPIKESSDSFSNRNQEIFGILEIILYYCFTHLVLLLHSCSPWKKRQLSWPWFVHWCSHILLAEHFVSPWGSMGFATVILRFCC